MKRILIILIVVIMSISMFGCDNKEDSSNNMSEIEGLLVKDNTNNSSIEESEDGTISVMYLSGNEQGEFQNYSKNIKIDIWEGWDDYEEAVDQESYEIYLAKREEVFLQIIAGGGPDIIYNFGDDQIYAFVKNDLLYDMTKNIENEEIFNIEDYATEVINVGNIGGKQCYIPLQFRVPALASFYDLELTDGIKKDDYITWDKIKELGSKYTGENGTKYFSDRTINYPYLLFNGKLIDYTSKKSFFANSDFFDLIKMNEEYYNIVPDEVLLGNNNSSLFIDKTEVSLFHRPYFYSKYLINLMKDGYNYYIYPIQRTTEDESIRCLVYDVIGINKSANNKDECFEFIRFKLSHITQLSSLIFLPTNKTTYFKYLDYIQSQYEGIDIGNFITSIKNIYENLEDGYLNDGIYREASFTFALNRDLEEDELLNLMDKKVSDAFNEE